MDKIRHAFNRKSYCKQNCRYEQQYKIPSYFIFASQFMILLILQCFNRFWTYLLVSLCTFELNDRFELFSILFFLVTGGNYQGGKQQRGGGGRQPRHQPY